MARNMLRLDTSALEEYIDKLESVNGNLEKVVEKALLKAGEQVTQDTLDAIQPQNLPHGGKYSNGDTEKSIEKNPTVQKEGTTLSIGVGFDFGKKSAGGFLITGTPKMRPVTQLQRIYKGKRYMNSVGQQMIEIFEQEIDKLLR